MKKDFLNLVALRNSIIFVLIFGNVIFNKLYASIKIGEIFYVNEILLFLLYLTIEKKFHSGFKYFLLLLPFPLFSILIFEYETYNVFKDYAIFYYPFVIYILVTKNIEIKNSVDFVISKTKFIYPYLPIYFSIYYVFTKRPLRATEAVCFSIILYFYAKLETEDTYKYFEDYLFYSFSILPDFSTQIINSYCYDIDWLSGDKENTIEKCFYNTFICNNLLFSIHIC